MFFSFYLFFKHIRVFSSHNLRIFENMTENKPKKRQDLRFEREAKALKKNLEKRKLQQKKRDELKQKSQSSCDEN